MTRVVDASVLAPALADDGPDGDLARERLRREQLAAPELVVLEVISTIRGACRAGRLDTRRCAQALFDLRALPLVCAPHRPLIDRVWELRDHASAYDAAYFALAEALNTTLLTADRRVEHIPGARCPVELIATAN